MLDTPTDFLTDQFVREFLDKALLGGWAQFVNEYRARIREELRKTAAPSPIMLKARAEYLLGRRLGDYDKIISANLNGDLKRTLSISFATVEQRSRFDRVTARTLAMYVWTRESTEGKWKMDFIEIEEDADEKHYHNPGAVMTADRAAAMREQVELCYRPGTSRAPMDGWVRRLEVSWKEAHAGETFPVA